MDARLLTYREAAGRMGLSTATIRRLVRTGRLEAVRLSHQAVRVKESDLAALIERHRARRSQQPGPGTTD